MKWETLSLPWQAAFEEAWDAYRNGSVPIGAALADETGAVIARGRNRLMELQTPSGHICHSELSHAELNTLLQVSRRDRPNIRGCVLYTTMEPCPLCMGALVMSNVRGMRFAARDGWAGSAAYSLQMPYIAAKKLNVEGPIVGLGDINTVLNAERAFAQNPNPTNILINRWSLDYPAAIAVALQWYADGTLIKASEEGRDAARVFDAIAQALNLSDLKRVNS